MTTTATKTKTSKTKASTLPIAERVAQKEAEVIAKAEAERVEMAALRGRLDDLEEAAELAQDAHDDIVRAWRRLDDSKTADDWNTTHAEALRAGSLL